MTVWTVDKRYDNSLPLPLVLRLVTSFSDDGEHVVDPFLGGGTTAVACWRTGRRFTGGDLNPHALRFSAARLLAEHAWPDDRQPALPGTGGDPTRARLAAGVRDALQLDLFGGARRAGLHRAADWWTRTACWALPAW